MPISIGEKGSFIRLALLFQIERHITYYLIVNETVYNIMILLHGFMSTHSFNSQIYTYKADVICYI